MKTNRIIPLAMLAIAVLPAYAQRAVRDTPGNQYYNPLPRGVTTTNSHNVWTTSRGFSHRRPNLYDGYYYSRTNGFELTPVIVTPPNGAPFVLGPVRQYTDDEYSRLVLATLSAPTIQPVSQVVGAKRLLATDQLGPEGGGQGCERVSVGIVDVLDRGLLLTETREELRLRGVRMMSERERNDVTRYYAREAIRTLRELLYDKTVTVVFEDPVRDSGGTLLGTVYLPDGTELNKLILQRGYGKIEPRDFLDDRDISELVVSENAARDAKVGLWSRTP